MLVFAMISQGRASAPLKQSPGQSQEELGREAGCRVTSGEASCSLPLRLPTGTSLFFFFFFNLFLRFSVLSFRRNATIFNKGPSLAARHGGVPAGEECPTAVYLFRAKLVTMIRKWLQWEMHRWLDGCMER